MYCNIQVENLTQIIECLFKHLQTVGLLLLKARIRLYITQTDITLFLLN